MNITFLIILFVIQILLTITLVISNLPDLISWFFHIIFTDSPSSSKSLQENLLSQNRLNALDVIIPAIIAVIVYGISLFFSYDIKYKFIIGAIILAILIVENYFYF